MEVQRGGDAMAKSVKTKKKLIDKTKTKEERRRNGIRNWTDFY